MNFSARRDTITKSVTLLSLTLVLGLGLLWFNTNRAVLTHQHPYFARMYLGIIQYRLGQFAGLFRPAAGQAAQNPGTTRSVPVLLYHGVRPGPDGENVSMGHFTDQMIALKQAGWQTVSIQDFYDFMRHGKRLPPKSFLLTFDDGRKDSYYPVDPLLATLGFRATMFVITKSSLTPTDSKFYLSRDELVTMRNSGHWDLQPHAAYGHYYYPVDAKGTEGHFYNNKLWLSSQGRLETDQEFADRVLGDLKLAKSEMAQAVGSNGIAFAYPFNEFGSASLNYPAAQSVLQEAVKSVFPVAFYQVWPNRGSTQNFPADPNFMMKRILIDSSVSNQKLFAKLADSSPKPLPYHPDLAQKTGSWQSTWGTYDWGAKGFTIKTDKDGYGGGAFLDGAADWHNYQATARLQLAHGEYARLYGHYVDDKDYISCTYTAGNVILEQAIDGVVHTLGSTDLGVPTGDTQAGFRIQGDQAGCLLDGQVVTTSDRFPAALPYGGIGFAMYGPDQGAASLNISGLAVDPLP